MMITMMTMMMTPGAVYASSDIHVSASEFETLGNTVLEAFAANIPVVVPHTQGKPSVVHPTAALSSPYSIMYPHLMVFSNGW